MNRRIRGKNRQVRVERVRWNGFAILSGTVAVASILAIMLFASQAPTLSQFLSVLSTAFTIACACFFAGGLTGFLFGVPRTLQGDAAVSTAESSLEEASPDNGNNRTGYQANTNLELISDWLTKIMVGVGLTQISAIPSALTTYADYTATGLGGYPSSRVFSLGLLVSYSIGGFLTGYLLTRLNLLPALVQADQAARIAQVEHRLSEFERQAEADARALGVIRRQLESGPETAPISQGELNAVIRQASPAAHDTIFRMAQEVRSDNWRANKPKMERTIPVFKALLTSSGESPHWYHGQLGYALKDQLTPDWSGADAELSEAVRLRGPWQREGFLHYEFNRAICRIHLDEAFRRGEKANDQTRQLILDDLQAAAHYEFLANLIADDKQDTSIKEWMKLNGVTDLD